MYIYLKKMNLKKYNFYFPSEPLKEEDFSPIEISLLKDYYRSAFLEFCDKMDKIIGKKKDKKIFIDNYCLNILNDILKKDDLNTKKITKIILLEKNIKDSSMLTKTEESIIIFIIQPEKEILNNVIKINLILNSTKKRDFLKKFLVFIPQENHDVIKYLQDNNFINDFIIDTLNYDIYPIDIDLLSLEKEKALKEIYIDANLSSINDLALSVVKLENIFGKIKYKYIKGDLAEKFCKILEEKEIDIGVNNSEEILGMIVLERSVDYLTLMCSNYTFEGLIDENFEINLGKIKIKESILKEGLNKEKKNSTIRKNNNIITYGLTSKINELYCAFRCMHYLDTSKLIVIIRDYYKKLAEDNKDNKKKVMSISKINELTKEMKEFLPYKDNLIKLENILNYILEQLQTPFYIKYIQREQLMLAGDIPQNSNLYEEHLYEKRDLIVLLKLLIIESLTQNGIKDYNKIKREILNIYGYQYIFLFHDLENIGWLKEKIFLNNIINLKKNITDLTYNQLIEKLDLVNINYNRENIEDCSYVFGGFCPLSLRLIEKAIEGNWHKISDIIKKIPGATIYPENEEFISNPIQDKNFLFLIFLGGITYTEIEGIRYLNRKYKEDFINKKRNKQIQFIIITTGILNSKKIFGNFGIKENPTFSMKQFKDCFLYEK